MDGRKTYVHDDSVFYEDDFETEYGVSEDELDVSDSSEDASSYVYDSLLFESDESKKPPEPPNPVRKEKRECPVCKDSFTWKSSAPNRKYCSRECSVVANSESSDGDRWIIFNRDSFKCGYCGARPNEDGVKLTLDHVVPFSKGGADTAENLWTSCVRCNLAKHDKPLTKESKEYINSEIKRRNKECGISPQKVIKGSHVR